jgi:hypothetical protein
VGADDGVERLVVEGKPAEPALGEDEVGRPLPPRRIQIGSDDPPAPIGAGYEVGEMPASAPRVEDVRSFHLGEHPVQARPVEIAFAVDRRDRGVEGGIFLGAHRPEPIAEGDEARRLPAPDQVHDGQEERRIPQRRGKQVLEHVADGVDGSSAKLHSRS